MRTPWLLSLVLPCLLLASPALWAEEKTDKDALQGVWAAQSMEVDGKPVPDEARQRMQFTFKGDKLLVRGNSMDGDDEMECELKLDATKSPKHLDFIPPDDPKETVQGIYELKGDDLKVCLRHGGSDKGRPKEFTTKEGEELILLVFKRKK